MSYRDGTDVDAAFAMKTFSELGYKLRVANDQTVRQMKDLLTSGNKLQIFIDSKLNQLHRKVFDIGIIHFSFSIIRVTKTIPAVHPVDMTLPLKLLTTTSCQYIRKMSRTFR